MQVMVKLVILRGKPTAGKSTAYASLKKKKEMKDWLFVDHCSLKDGLGKEFGKKSLFAILKVVMPSKKDIIIEEMSRESVNEYIGKEIKKYGYKIIVFQFEVSINTAYKRDIKRAKERWHPVMGKRLIKTLHIMHEKRFDNGAILVDCDKLGKREVVEFIIKKIK